MIERLQGAPNLQNLRNFKDMLGGPNCWLYSTILCKYHCPSHFGPFVFFVGHLFAIFLNFGNSESYIILGHPLFDSYIKKSQKKVPKQTRIKSQQTTFSRKVFWLLVSDMKLRGAVIFTIHCLQRFIFHKCGTTKLYTSKLFSTTRTLELELKAA